MKALKLGVFAMALGFFAVSCTDTTTDNTEAPAETTVETTTTETTVAPDSTGNLDTVQSSTTTTEETPAE